MCSSSVSSRAPGASRSSIKRFTRGVRVAALPLLISLAGCASAPQEEAAAADAQAASARQHSASAAPNRTRSIAQVKNLDAYKQAVAQHIAQHSGGGTFDGRLPEILKSVVVLDITIDADGKPTRVKVHRSNGFKNLERIAMESVERAGPLPAPSADVMRGRTSVSYMETWLFRNDGRYQIRSLVTEPQPGYSADMQIGKM